MKKKCADVVNDATFTKTCGENPRTVLPHVQAKKIIVISKHFQSVLQNPAGNKGHKGLLELYHLKNDALYAAYVIPRFSRNVTGIRSLWDYFETRLHYNMHKSNETACIIAGLYRFDLLYFPITPESSAQITAH